jgi:hypothetical protein
MKKLQAKITIRFLVAMLVAVAVIGLSGLAMHAPTQNQSSLALKNIQTDKATVLYADYHTNGAWFVELVLPTGDSKLATENLKSLAATL